MDTEAKEIMDQVAEMFENCLLMLSSSMLTSAIISSAVLPVFVPLKNYFLYSVNIPEAVLGCLVVCVFLAFILSAWLYPIVADNKLSYFNQYPMWMKILDFVICWLFLGVVNYTLAVGGIAILLSWVIIFSTGSGHIYLSDRLESIKKDIAEQEELKRKELLKNTRALTRMDVYDILYMP